jgi:hypothetical protein
MYKSVNAFQMLVLVLILIGVVMIFMRQNNTCVMNNDETIEGFQELGFSTIWNKDFKNLVRNNKAQYGPKYTHKGKDKRVVRLKAVSECNSDDDCVGLEVDRTGNHTITQVLISQNMKGNLGRLSTKSHLSDRNKKNVILKKTAFKDIIDTETNGKFSHCMTKYDFEKCKRIYDEGTL